MKNKLLVINPGSTSTKLAVYQHSNLLWQANIEHSAQVLSDFPTIYAQLDMRYQHILQALEEHGDKLEELVAVVARGGLLPPVSAGAYEVNPEMLEVLEHNPVNHHASNLGAALAYRIAHPLNIKAYIYDPVTVDEMIDIVRITGLKEVMRHGQGHNLNMRAAALHFCREQSLDYKDVNLIVCHLGGGITLSLHSHGRIIDMVSDDDGAFSPERAGGIPAFRLAKLACAKPYPVVMKQLQRNGGLVSHLGTTDVRTVEKMIDDGNEYAHLVYESMALAVSRCIAKLAVVVDGAVDAVILTGGIAYSERFTSMITKRVSFLAPVHILPGENEMQALMEGAMRVLRGEEPSHVFHKEEPLNATV